MSSEEFWNWHFAIIEACYPVFHILRLADMKIGGMDKLYFYIRLKDRVLQPAMENVIAFWKSQRMPTMDMSKIKLTKSDKEWLKGKRNEMYLM